EKMHSCSVFSSSCLARDLNKGAPVASGRRPPVACPRGRVVFSQNCEVVHRPRAPAHRLALSCGRPTPFQLRDRAPPSPFDRAALLQEFGYCVFFGLKEVLCPKLWKALIVRCWTPSPSPPAPTAINCARTPGRPTPATSSASAWCCATCLTSPT